MKHHILSIGVSKLQNISDHDLDFAAKDATDFFNLFVANLGDIGYQKLLTDSEATLSQIRTALGTDLQTSVQPGDVFFFYFSGHGTTAPTDEPNVLSHYLVPFDATRDIASSGISVEYIRQVFDKLPVKAKFIFVDSCFSGAVASVKGITLLFPKTKSVKSVKTLSGTVTGKGSVTFTASGEKETALEDEENKNGLFTHFLLEELRRPRQEPSFSVTDIFTPITEGVVKRAKTTYNHVQNPTSTSHLEGVVSLPTLKNAPKILPGTIDVPRYPALTETTFPVPAISLTDHEQEKIVNDSIKFVLENAQHEDNQTQRDVFRRYCGQLLKELRTQWDRVFANNAQRIEFIPQSVAEFEGASFQIILLGGVIASYGSTRQMADYAKEIVKILTFGKQQAGLVVIPTIPEIVIAEIVYTIGVISVFKEDFAHLKKLLEAKVWGLRDGDYPPEALGDYPYYHYCDALGGHSDKVNDHIRKALESYKWLPQLAPDVEGKILDFQLQANMLIVAYYNKRGHQLWSDFGRWYPERIRPLVRKIKYDPDIHKKVSEFIGEPDSQLITFFQEQFKQLQGAMGMRWDSITPDEWLTEGQRRQLNQNAGG